MLNVLAERLRVRTITDVGWKLTQAQEKSRYPNKKVGGVRYDYREVPDEVKRMFVSLLQHKSGEFSFGFCNNYKKSGYSMPICGANHELERVFEKLPPLEAGEEYAFPCKTCFFLPMPKKENKNWKAMSLWVQAAVQEAENQ